MKNRIPAFTIIEVMVTVALTSLVILLSFTIYNSFNKIFQKALETIELNYQIILFDQLFNKDFKKAKSVTFDEQSIRMVNPDDSYILYEFSDSKIVRNQNESCDTFLINTNNIECHYIYSNLVEEIEFNILSMGSTINYYSFKKYNNSFLVNKEVADGN